MKDINQPPEIIELINKYIQKHEGFLLLSGKNGTGKTFIARAIYDNFHVYDSDLKYFTTLSELNITWQKQIADWGNALYLLTKIVNTRLLVLDDVGTRKPTDAFMDFLYAIVDKRCTQQNEKATIVTTNLNAKDLREMFGDAFFSRICSGVYKRIDGEDRRLKKEF